MIEDMNIPLLDRFLRGETSVDEERRLLEWFRSESSQEAIYTYYKQKWEAAANKELPAEVQARIFLQIKDKLEEREGKNTPPRKCILFQIVRYIAILLLCMGVGVSAWYMGDRGQRMEMPQDYVVLADNGQRASVILPDGTKVWLNSHTRLTYGTDYGQEERFVSLSGEAYFEVAKDTKHRFVVKMGDLEVEALGTAFNVKAYPEDPESTVTLFEGCIRATVGNKEVTIFPDQYVRLDKISGRLQFSNSESTSYARMWRENKLAFERETLEDIAILLNRMYNVEVCFLSEKIKSYRFSGVIQNNSLDNVIEIISLTAPIMYESVGDTVYLREKK